jgi:hypothetical protein
MPALPTASAHGYKVHPSINLEVTLYEKSEDKIHFCSINIPLLTLFIRNEIK